MSIHLVYRTPYREKNLKFHKKFSEDSLIEWFGSLWEYYDKDADRFHSNVIKYIGSNIYGFTGPFYSEIDSKEFDEGLSNPIPPKTIQEIKEKIDNGYTIAIDVVNDEAIQVLTEDDELDSAYYIFTENYSENNPQITSFLIRNSWNLPEEYSSDSKFEPLTEIRCKLNPENSSAATSFIVISNDWMSGGNLSSLESKVIEVKGVRINNLMAFLAKSVPDKGWNMDLLFMRSQFESGENSTKKTIINFSEIPEFYIQNHISLELYYNFDLEQLRQENYLTGKDYLKSYYREVFKSTGIVKNRKAVPSKFQFSDHLIQSSIYTETWKGHPTFDIGTDFPTYYHYIFFDDLWATENKDLANSILSYGMKWDVLK